MPSRAIKVSIGLTKDILDALATGVIVALKIADKPTIGNVLDVVDEEIYSKYDRISIFTTLKRLEKQKFISWREKNGKTTLMLEEKGRRKLLSYKLNEMRLNKPKKWDGLFRVIIFDIPENKKIARENLRKKLKELEFYKLQKSVFVSPYECRDEIDFLKNIYGVDSCVHYILAKEVPNVDLSLWFVSV